MSRKRAVRSVRLLKRITVKYAENGLRKATSKNAERSSPGGGRKKKKKKKEKKGKTLKFMDAESNKWDEKQGN